MSRRKIGERVNKSPLGAMRDVVRGQNNNRIGCKNQSSDRNQKAGFSFLFVWKTTGRAGSNKKL